MVSNLNKNVNKMFMGLFLLGTLSIANFSQAVAKGNAAKYAVIDMQAVILNVSDGKAARAKLEVEIKAKEKSLLSEKESLDKMNQEWQTQAPLLSEAARFKKQQEFQEKFMKLRNEESSFQNEIKKKEQTATQGIAMTVTKIVNKMSEEQGFEMVFETSSAGLVYLKDPVDITKNVIDAYEAKSGTAEGVTTPKSAKK